MSVDLENDALEDVGEVDLVFDVIGGDIEMHAEQIDRPFLRDQRRDFLAAATS